MYILYLLRNLAGLFLLEMPVNLSQYRGSVGIFNNRNFFVQSKFSHFSYSSDNNATNNNTNLTIDLLFLLNKIALVFLVLNLMFVFKGNGSKHKKITFIWTFNPGDSCINQLLSITHEIHQSFDYGFDVRSVFLNISKAFDKVWHDGLIFKLKQNDISGNILNVIKFLKK